MKYLTTSIIINKTNCGDILPDLKIEYYIPACGLIPWTLLSKMGGLPRTVPVLGKTSKEASNANFNMISQLPCTQLRHQSIHTGLIYFPSITNINFLLSPGFRWTHPSFPPPVSPPPLSPTPATPTCPLCQSSSSQWGQVTQVQSTCRKGGVQASNNQYFMVPSHYVEITLSGWPGPGPGTLISNNYTALVCFSQINTLWSV